MAKPPKKFTDAQAIDFTKHKKNPPENNPLQGEHSGLSGRPAHDIEPAPGTGGTTVSPGISPHQLIVVTDMPGSSSGSGEVTTKPVSWPRSQIDQLHRIDDTGLFMSAEHKLYADTGEEGIRRIEPNAKGEYQIPFPAVPGKPGPIVAKIPGEPQWRIERQGLDASGNGNPLSMRPSDAPAEQSLKILLPVLAEKLTKAGKNGLRYDKLKQVYVDVAGAGTVMVRRNADGEYQATNSRELTPSGPLLEIIEGMTLWQRKPQRAESPVRPPATEDSGPGPSKRLRFDDDIEPAGPPANIDPVAVTTTQNPYLWASWGKTTKPDAVESIQIGQLYYPIVPQGPLVDKLPFAFIQHPQFAPSRFEAFEHMLREAPELQPVLTYRDSQNAQKVNGATRVFEKPLTRYVADRFQRFTDQTSRVVAERLFELSSNAGEINGSGIARMMQTFRHWDGKSAQGVSGVGDPLDMLPIIASRDVSRRIVPLLLPESVQTLQQLNFDPSSHWENYAGTETAVNLKTLFVNILNDSGYDTLTPDAVTHINTLVFQRPNHPKVYFMKLGRVTTDGIEIRTPLIPELDDPLLINRMSAEMHQTLVAADALNDMVWLIGGVQHLPDKRPSIFIIRDR